MGVRIPPQQLMDLETSPLPEVGNDSSTDSTVTIIAASAGAACVVAAALVVGIRRKRMRSSLPSASSDTSDIVVKSDPALARPPVASRSRNIIDTSRFEHFPLYTTSYIL